MSHATDYQPTNTDEQYQEVKRRVFERWGIEPPADANECGSSFDQLVASVHEKTGVAREQVETFIANTRTEIAERFAQAQASIEPRAAEIDARARQIAAEMSEKASTQYRDAEAKVKEKPMTALAIAFGVGIAAGLLLGTGRRA